MTTEKIEAFWVNATADDVAGVMAGETVEARFRDSDDGPWEEYSLRGWRYPIRGSCGWIDTDGAMWHDCQVYREPSWHANKPDPGPGWRLLGKLPDEPKLATDEAWDCHLKEWRQTFTNDGDQVKTVWYRRRIEPVEPEPKHYVLRVGDSVETPRGHLIEVVSLNAEQRIYSLDAGDKLTLPNGQTITITAKGFEVTQ
jgi:hypothetical protein